MWSSTEFRTKVSESQKKAWTPERKKRQSEITKAKWTEEAKKKHSELLTGRTFTEEQKQKLRKPKHSGHGAKVSASLKGKTKSPEHVAKIKERAKNMPIEKKLHQAQIMRDKVNAMSPEELLHHKQKIKDGLAKVQKQECPYCHRLLDPGNYKKHHGEKCKAK